MAKRPRGTKDILPSEIKSWNFIEDKIKSSTRAFSYKELRTPIFEHLEVFSRSIGESSDIVNKEMYVFSKGEGKSSTYALRPEMTAALVRAAIENSFVQPGSIERLWYYGPFFRYERPQAGRQRQFHQFGAECLGSSSPLSDFEVISLALHFADSIGIKSGSLLINSLGNSASRNNYFKVLTEYLNDNKEALSDLSKIRLEKNPLRVLDSKQREDIEIIQKSPKIKEYLDSESLDHINKVYELLDSQKIKYVVDDNLVRGLDYYSHTVFEFRSESLGSQDSFGGGGRYNELFSQLGGKDIPAVGFAMGIERLLLILEKQSKLPTEDDSVDVYIVKADDKADSIIETISHTLRKKNFSVIRDIKSKSVKSQFKDANKNNAKWVITIGATELENKSLTIKNMKDSSQKLILISEIEKFDF